MSSKDSSSKDPASRSLAGILIPAATPYARGSGDADPVALKANLRIWLEAPVIGVVIGGSTGEAVMLEDAERDALLAAAREVVPPSRWLVAGTGGESTPGTIRRSREAVALGADALLIQPPAFYKGAMNQDRLRAHYEAVADAVSVPVIVYQVPLRFSTLDLDDGLIATLAQHPNILGMKDSRGDLDRVARIAQDTPDTFQLLVGTGAKLLASLERGAVGAILGVANVAADLSAQLVRAWEAGDHDRAAALQEVLAPLHDGIVGALGVAGVKAGMDALGMQGGAPRLPLTPLSAEGVAQVRTLLGSAGLL
jgi:4-hydroxy-2-oxoglutarate aldolase